MDHIITRSTQNCEEWPGMSNLCLEGKCTVTEKKLTALDGVQAKTTFSTSSQL